MVSARWRTPHSTSAVRDHLDQRFRQTSKGRGGPIAWPARSPGLTPLDYFLRDHMKILVYEIPVDSEEDLLERIMAAVDVELPGICVRVYEDMRRRCSSHRAFLVM